MEEICGINVISIIDEILPKDIKSCYEGCGAYIITYISGKRYGGSGKNCQLRVLSWYRKPHTGEIFKSAKIYMTEDEVDARLLELELVNNLNLELNVITMYDSILLSSQTKHTNTRIIQQKKKNDESVYVNISSKKAGLHVGDVVKIVYIDNNTTLMVRNDIYEKNLLERET